MCTKEQEGAVAYPGKRVQNVNLFTLARSPLSQVFLINATLLHFPGD